MPKCSGRTSTDIARKRRVEKSKSECFSNYWDQNPGLSQNGNAILAVNVCPHIPCKCKHSKFQINSSILFPLRTAIGGKNLTLALSMFCTTALTREYDAAVESGEGIPKI